MKLNEVDNVRERERERERERTNPMCVYYSSFTISNCKEYTLTYTYITTHPQTHIYNEFN